MTWIDALIMGIVQGLAEFLPISSSGHLEICSSILGLNLNGADALDFDATLHVATVLSTIVVLWHEFAPLCRSFFTFKNDGNTRYVLKLLLSCIPVGIVGLCFKDTVEGFFGGSLTLVGVCLLVTATLLTLAWLTSRHPANPYDKDPRKRGGRNISWLDAFIIGCAQAIAVLPGLSRSGTTIATGIILGDKREQVARFSFLMVIIPILGEALLDLVKMAGSSDAATSPVGWLPLTVGFLASFLVGCAACKWMLEIVKRGKLVYFAIYCVAVGILCLIF